MADLIHDVIMIGCFAIALGSLALAYRIARRDSREWLAELERRASKTTKEEWSKRMETTKADLNRPRTLRRWPS
jgi:hypothetical protein